MRVTSEFWVGAYLRRAQAAGAYALIYRKGAKEAGAIFLRIDRLDGRVQLLGPAPQSLIDDGMGDERRFMPLHADGFIDPIAANERMEREIRFDRDLWIVDVEDRQGRIFAEVVDPDQF